MAPDAPVTNGPPPPDSGIPSRSTTSDGPWTPDTVLSTLPEQPQQASSSPVPFFHILERLKTTKREGWRRFDINHGESIGDHMYRMSIITLFCPPSLTSRGINIARCTQMALVHDMAELLVGDITPVDGVSKSEKSRREAETMDYLTRNLLGHVYGGANGRQIREIWQEYEDGETLESHFVHDVDKIELLLQMVEYEKADPKGGLDLGDFSRVAERIVLPEVQAWARELLEERDRWFGKFGKVPHGVQHISAERMKQQDEYYGNGHGNGTGSD